VATKLQKIARERNWYKGCVARNLNIRGMREIPISDATQRKVDVVNMFMEDVRESIDDDWEAEKLRLKKELTSQLLAEKCEHGKGLTDYCEPCGRINSNG